MLNRRTFLAAATAGLAAPALVRAQGTTPIRTGEINSYTTAPAFTLPYRSGSQLAVADINAGGGLRVSGGLKQREKCSLVNVLPNKMSKTQ